VVAALIVLALVLESTDAFAASAHPGAAASRLRPAIGQPAPHSLLDSKPIAAVAQAVRAVRVHAPLPAPLSPSSISATAPGLYVPFRCVPQFGPGTTFDMCALGDVASRHVVALIGDSHAWMWIPGLSRAASILHFELIPVTKPGCLLVNLHENRPGWPCRTWYLSALRIVRRLHPSATIASFMTSNLDAGEASFAATELHSVLKAVPHGVLIADPPNYNVFSEGFTTPGSCLSSAGATQATCAIQQPAAMDASLGAIQAMARRYRYPAVPTLQWFCADGTCPVVIDGTVTTEDGSHITDQYSTLLAPLLADDLRPILGGLWLRETRPPTGMTGQQDPSRPKMR
jgi:hypothetical protein